VLGYLFLNNMQINLESQEELVKLYVGGELFKVSKATLLLQKDSYFTAMISGGYSSNDEVFIDRSSDMFTLVLDFLRDGIVVQDSSKNLDKLNLEAKYFSLSALTNAIQVLKEAHHSGMFCNVVKQLEQEVVCQACINREGQKHEYMLAPETRSKQIEKYSFDIDDYCSACGKPYYSNKAGKILCIQKSFCQEWSCCGNADKDSYLCA
jgi:hypothetical protein